MAIPRRVKKYLHNPRRRRWKLVRRYHLKLLRVLDEIENSVQRVRDRTDSDSGRIV